MRMNKCAYLFAAALVASTVGMTSCSNEDVAGIEQGVENKVTLSMSVADKFGTRSSADEVNLGSTLSTIKNVVVVPMIGEAYQNPIIMGDLDPNSLTDKTIKKTASLNSNINYFKVYGNVDAGKFNADKIFTGFELEATSAGQKGEVNVYNPHGLYYYGYAGTAENQIQVGAEEGSYSPLTAGKPISTNKYIKLQDVNYAVGVLAAAVLNGDATTECVFDAPSEGNAEAVSKTNVTVSGIIINGQKLKLDEDFEAVGGDVVSVYEEATNGDFVTSDNKLSADKKTTGNIYCVVTETGTTVAPGQAVTGNIEFELAAGKYLQLADGSRIGGADATKFYLAFSLQPESAKAVFMKDYSTFFNATVKNWGLASDKPIEVTDANIAVTVDMDWHTGIIYDVEI